ncbi:MAG: hypothetical protein GC165_13060 [Armatimonadetes bacterium]|nr:hypothetical protein [Armatimonadota bacterium]
MNFAAPALLILLLLLPGVIARNSYLRGTFQAHPFKAKSIAEEAAFSAVISVVLHLAFITGIDHFYPQKRVNIEYAMALLFGPASGNDKFSLALKNVSSNAGAIAAYFSVLYICSYLFAVILHVFVRAGRCDLQSRLLRFDHPWYYLFESNILDFDKMAGPFPSSNVDAVFTSVLVEQDSKTFIYRGIVDKYYFADDGTLDRILLICAQRAVLSDVLEQEKNGMDVYAPFVWITDSDYLVIFMKDVINLNVHYWDIGEK